MEDGGSLEMICCVWKVAVVVMMITGDGNMGGQEEMWCEEDGRGRERASLFLGGASCRSLAVRGHQAAECRKCIPVQVLNPCITAADFVNYAHSKPVPAGNSRLMTSRAEL